MFIPASCYQAPCGIDALTRRQTKRVASIQRLISFQVLVHSSILNTNNSKISCIVLVLSSFCPSLFSAQVQDSLHRSRLVLILSQQSYICRAAVITDKLVCGMRRIRLNYLGNDSWNVYQPMNNYLSVILHSMGASSAKEGREGIPHAS